MRDKYVQRPVVVGSGRFSERLSRKHCRHTPVPEGSTLLCRGGRLLQADQVYHPQWSAGMWVYNVPRQRLQLAGNNWPQTRLREGQNKAPARLVMWEQRYVICVCTRRRIKNSRFP